MPTENTSLKNTTPAGDSSTTNEMVIGKNNTYQRTFLIVAGSLLALLVLIVVAGTSGGQHLESSAHEIAKGAMALVDYQVDSANLGLTKDIFGFGAVSENDEDCQCGTCKYGWKYGCCSCSPVPVPTSFPTPIPYAFSGWAFDCNGHRCDNVLCTVGCRR